MTMQGDTGARPARQMPYIAGLDGLRALAVLAVLLYHGQDVSGISSLLKPQGGFLGVEVFFVISGFLITALLLQEHQRAQTIDLRAFWIRRGRRLLPALYLFLVGTLALAALFASDALDKIGRELLGAVFYVSNWVLLASDQSYFEAAGRPSLFRHLWSLAIEEQFYLIWPVVVLGVFRLAGPKLLGALIAVAIGGSTALMWMLFDGVEQYGDVTSVYYRTDARAAALLVGSLLAVVWRPWERTQRVHEPSAVTRWLIDVVGFAALGFVVYMNFAFTDRVIEWDSYERLYHGGFLALAGSTAVVIAAVAVPGSQFGAALGNPVLRCIGVRSYALYLWHWPVFQLTRPRLDLDIDGYVLLGVRLAVTFALVEVSYRFVELPIRERRFGSALRTLLTPRGIALGTASALGLIAITAAAAVALPTIDRASSDEVLELATDGAATERVTSPSDLATEEAAEPGDENVSDAASAAHDLPAFAPSPPTRVTEPTPEPTSAPTPEPTVPPTSDEAGADPPVEVIADVRSPVPTDPEAMDALGPAPTPTQTALPPPPPLSAPFDIATSQIHIVGDSVIEGAQHQLARISPRVTVDGRIGRQWWELAAELRQMRAQGLANDVVVIQLGNNGNFTTQMFDSVMNALSGTRLVVFVNVHAPVLWEAEVNRMLINNVNRYAEQARLLDWYSASLDHPEYFIEDGTHLQRSGIIAFSQLIESSLVDLG